MNNISFKKVNLLLLIDTSVHLICLIVLDIIFTKGSSNYRIILAIFITRIMAMLTSLYLSFFINKLLNYFNIEFTNMYFFLVLLMMFFCSLFILPTGNVFYNPESTLLVYFPFLLTYLVLYRFNVS